MKIASKIHLINTAAFAVILGIVAVVAILEARSLFEKRIGVELSDKSATIREMITVGVDATVKTHLRSIAEANYKLMEFYYDRYLAGEITEDEAYETVARILVDPEYGKVGDTGYLAGVTTEGILAIHPRSPGADASGYEFMQQAMAMKNGYLEYMWKNAGEVEERAKAGWLSYFEPWDIMVWASSYRDEFVAMVHPDDFRTRVLGIRLGETGYPYVFDGDGTVVIHPEIEGQNVYDQQDSNGVFFVREIIEQKNGTIWYTWQGGNDPAPRMKLADFVYVEELDWYVVSTYYEDELFAELAGLERMLFFLVVGALAIIFLVNFLIGRIVSRPITQMTGKISAAVSERIDLRTRIESTRSDEIGILGSLFDRMFTSMQSVVGDIQRVGIRTKQLSENLAANTEEVSATMEEISGTLNSFREKTGLLDTEMSDATRAVDDIDGSVRGIAESIEEQAAAVNETSASIQTIIGSIRNVSDLAEERRGQIESLSGRVSAGKGDLSETVRAIDDIASSADSVFGVIAIINKVTSQTNLLAMNAAIEAAHAGDAGKGFAVVAEEIRNLAETTAESTNTIKASVQDIVNKIRSAKDRSRSTDDTFQAVLDEIVSVSESLERILNGMRDVATGSEQVQRTVESLNSGTASVRGHKEAITGKMKVINQAMGNLSQLSAENLEAIREINVSIDEVVSSIRALQELGASNSESLAVMEEGTARFLV